MKNTHTVKTKGRVYRYFRPTQRGREVGQRPERLPDCPVAAAERVAFLEGDIAADRTALLYAHVRGLISGAQKRAKARGLEFSITADDLVAMFDAQRRRCAVSGIPFSLTDRGTNRRVFRKPLRPSLDRRDPSRGYTLDNIRLVCTAVNVALNEWGETLLRRVAEGVLRNVRATERGKPAWKTLGEAAPDET